MLSINIKVSKILTQTDCSFCSLQSALATKISAVNNYNKDEQKFCVISFIRSVVTKISSAFNFFNIF